MCSKKSSCAQPPEWPFELGFTEQIPKILEDNSEHFQALWETLFESERAKKAPKYISARNVLGLFLRNEHEIYIFRLTVYELLVIYGHLHLNQGHPTVRFGGISVRWGLNRPKYSDLIAVKTKDFFGDWSPQTFVTRGLINSYCFRLERKIRSAGIFGEYQQLGNSASRILFPKIFCGLNFQLKTANISTCVSWHKYAF